MESSAGTRYLALTEAGVRTATVRHISALKFHIQSLRVTNGNIVPRSWDQGARYIVLPDGSVLVSGADSWNAPDPWGAVSYDSDVENPSSEGTQRPKRRADNETSGKECFASNHYPNLGIIRTADPGC